MVGWKLVFVPILHVAFPGWLTVKNANNLQSVLYVGLTVVIWSSQSLTPAILFPHFYCMYIYMFIGILAAILSSQQKTRGGHSVSSVKDEQFFCQLAWRFFISFLV